MATAKVYVTRTRRSSVVKTERMASQGSPQPKKANKVLSHKPSVLRCSYWSELCVPHSWNMPWRRIISSGTKRKIRLIRKARVIRILARNAVLLPLPCSQDQSYNFEYMLLTVLADVDIPWIRMIQTFKLYLFINLSQHMLSFLNPDPTVMPYRCYLQSLLLSLGCVRACPRAR